VLLSAKELQMPTFHNETEERCHPLGNMTFRHTPVCHMPVCHSQFALVSSPTNNEFVVVVAAGDWFGQVWLG